MAFPIKTWIDEPAEDTPMDAEALMDTEERLSAYTDTEVDTAKTFAIAQGQIAANVAEANANAYADTIANALPLRTIDSQTVASMTDNEELEWNVPVGPGARFIGVETTIDARVRIYADETSRDDDAARPEGEAPDATTNLILEVFTVSPNLEMWCVPAVDGHVSVYTDTFPALVQNLSGGTAAMTVTFSYVPTEQYAV